MIFSKKLLTIWVALGGLVFPEAAYCAVTTVEPETIYCSFNLDAQHLQAGETFCVTLICDQLPDPYTTDLEYKGLDMKSMSYDQSTGKYVYTYRLYARQAGLYDVAAPSLSFDGVPYPLAPIRFTVGEAAIPWIPVAAVGLPVLLYAFSLMHARRNRRKNLPEHVIHTGRINLRSVKAICRHFLIPVGILFIPFLTGIYVLSTYYFKNPLVLSMPMIAGLIVIPFVLAIVATYIQYRRLFFKPVATKLPISEIYKLITELGSREQWTCSHPGRDYYACRTNPDRYQSILGEQIFMVFDKERIWINSICDLNKNSFGSLFGRTERNIQLITEGIREWEGAYNPQ
ncbi:MAG: BatD family protein [Prevotellaceae bacterium]|jgi:hypothetical protein|nr:BatD family protein [Prevotellaceae bacterium]